MKMKQNYKSNWITIFVPDGSSQDVGFNHFQGEMTCFEHIFIASKLIDLRE